MDGVYRVQTTRIESLEVSEQIIATRANDQSKLENATFQLTDIRKTETGVAISVVESKKIENTAAAAATDNGQKATTLAQAVTVKLSTTATKGRTSFKRHMVNRWLDDDGSSISAINNAPEQKYSFEGRFKTEESASEADCTMDDEDADGSSDDNNCITASECSPVKCIDDFSVMQKYLKKKRAKNKIIITVDEVDERGNIVHTETRDATEFHM